MHLGDAGCSHAEMLPHVHKDRVTLLRVRVDSNLLQEITHSRRTALLRHDVQLLTEAR